MKKAALLVILLSLVTQVVGFAKEASIAMIYGASSVSDAYVVSILSPILIVGILASGLSSVFTPKYNYLLNKFGSDLAFYYVRLIVYGTFIITACIGVFVYMFSDGVVGLFAYGLEGEDKYLASDFLKISSFAIPFIVMNTLLIAYAQINGKHVFAAFLIFFGNILALFFVLSSVSLGYYYLIYGYVVSNVVQGLFLAYAAGLVGFRILHIREVFEEVKDTYKKSFAVMVGVLFNQINFVVDRSMATTLQAGSVSIMNYAVRLGSIVDTVIIASVLSIFYPLACKYSIKDNKDVYTRAVEETLFVILFFTIPAVIFIQFYSFDLVTAVFLRGEFSLADAARMNEVFVVYSFLIPISAIKIFVLKVFYSRSITSIPMIVSMLSVALNVVMNFILINSYGLKGLAVSSVVAGLFNMLLMLFLARKKGLFDVDIAYFVKCVAILITAFGVPVLLARVFSSLVDVQLANYHKILFEIPIVFMFGVILFLLVFGTVLDRFSKDENSIFLARFTRQRWL